MAQLEPNLNEEDFVSFHSSNILNIKLNKQENLIYTISNECIKAWSIIINNEMCRLKLLQEYTFENQQIPLYSFDQLIDPSGQNSYDLKQINTSTFFKLDSTENYLYILDKTGAVFMIDLNSTQMLYTCCKFSIEQASTIELWNASHLCILLVGSLNGTVRIFKLLHQF